MPDAIRYTIEDISSIASAFTHNTENKIKIIAAIISNPSVIVIPPETPRYQ